MLNLDNFHSSTTLKPIGQDTISQSNRQYICLSASNKRTKKYLLIISDMHIQYQIIIIDNNGLISKPIIVLSHQELKIIIQWLIECCPCIAEDLYIGPTVFKLEWKSSDKVRICKVQNGIWTSVLLYPKEINRLINIYKLRLHFTSFELEELNYKQSEAYNLDIIDGQSYIRSLL